MSSDKLTIRIDLVLVAAPFSPLWLDFRSCPAQRTNVASKKGIEVYRDTAVSALVMSLRIQVDSECQHCDFEHLSGSLEFGRGPQREAMRCLINDPNCSRDQLLVKELPDGCVRVENLSRRIAVAAIGQDTIEVGQIRELSLPIGLQAGKTRILISAPDWHGKFADLLKFDSQTQERGVGQKTNLPRQAERIADLAVDLAGLTSIPPSPAKRVSSGGQSCATQSWGMLADDPTERLAGWLQTIIDLQTNTPGSSSFYEKVARALVDLIDLDLGLALLRHDGDWKIAGIATADDTVSARFSRTLANHVAREGQCFYQDLDKFGPTTASLAGVDAAVASPIFGSRNEVVGVLYGSRGQGRIISRGSIGRLEAQFVQLLAAAAGSNLAREVATKTRVQFEQFFSTDLVSELERDPNLLEGRTAAVTILFSDLRASPRLPSAWMPRRPAACFAT